MQEAAKVELEKPKLRSVRKDEVSIIFCPTRQNSCLVILPPFIAFITCSIYLCFLLVYNSSTGLLLIHWSITHQLVPIGELIEIDEACWMGYCNLIPMIDQWIHNRPLSICALY